MVFGGLPDTLDENDVFNYSDKYSRKLIFDIEILFFYYFLFAQTANI